MENESLRYSHANGRAAPDVFELNSALDEHAIVGVTDGAGRILHANDRFCALSKYSRQELIGQDHRLINSGQHPKSFFQTLWKTICTGQVWKGEICNRAKDGELYWVATTIVPIVGPEGRPERYIAIRTDITERKRAEHELRVLIKDLADFKSALDEHAIVAITDARGRITYVNDKFCAISKYSREELIGQDHRIINSRQHPSSFFGELWRTISQGRVWKGEICNRSKDGEFYWVDTTIVPFVSPDGKPQQYIAIRADITERKRSEQRQQELLSALKKTNLELDEFAHVVSHDLKAPLRGISSLASWIAADHQSSIGEAGREQLDLLLGRVNRMNALIDGILRYSRIGREFEDIAEIDVGNLLHDVLELLSPPPSIQIEIATTMPRIRVERTRLMQVFENLVSNAIKYMGKSYGTIVFGCNESPDEWEFYVKDTGIGIAPQHFDRIFKIFQTLRHSSEAQSTGIGLAIVKKNIETSGGRVWVESELGHGSTFHFALPKENRTPRRQ